MNLVQPSYKCGVTYTGTLYETTQAIEDKFSVNTTSGGNRELDYPVALMTADEVSYYRVEIRRWFKSLRSNSFRNL